MTITHLNPPTMHSNPAFSQGVRVDGAGALVVVGGQNGVDGTGAVVSAELGLQSAQALRNVLAVLEAAGATQDDVIKLTVYIVEGGDIARGSPPRRRCGARTRPRSRSCSSPVSPAPIASWRSKPSRS
jgi:enamine deaminase RidA (YjgF/YER057c/UK114 family)